MIEILKVPSILTVQDNGRRMRRFGVPVGGFADDVSARLANFLVGNPGDAPLLEFILAGPTIRFLRSSVFAVVGDVDVRLNGVPIEPYTSYWAKPADILEVGVLKRGVYGYIAFAGGISCAKLLGSCSTYARAGLGRPLRAGDVLPFESVLLMGRAGRHLPEELRPRFDGPVRVVLGPEEFGEEDIEKFLGAEYRVTSESDRMGIRLEGPELHGRGIVTSPLTPGTVQVPPGGQPIVMLADSQTTGGYSRIAVVIRADLYKVAQRRPGETVRFEAVDVREAREAFLRKERWLKALSMFLEGKMRAFKVRVGGRDFLAFVE
ncbi:5-oxoprolinase subunit C family protein [Pyrococcus yayanosii]|uniref:Allophanate hydrolase, subunit 2 n=1 Tax=Pyrococcus yayanosii (strain CH1 / JCM 16557) TaxID=529709 RepID=F8AHK9_PYRYC|nr:biotin-dependent carboxyltransferase family protein [Pyrococcus yayanosii]AEH25380.1 allophanate hydrolase, subunit 2 [Pyrococcus yayanosii CH1]